MDDPKTTGHHNLTLVQVSTRKERDAFINLPYQLYRENKRWVPPLKISQEEILNQRHPFWQANPNRFFLAMCNRKAVGRIAVFLDRDHEQHTGIKSGFFGFLESIEDESVFQALFMQARKYLSSLGCSNMKGPFNPSIHYELGVLVDGFDEPPYFMLTYNPPFYGRMIERCGMTKLKDFFAYKLHTKDFVLSEKMQRVHKNRLATQNITIRTPDLKKFNSEIRIFHEIYNNAFINHWGFSPMSWEDFQFLAKDLKTILDKEMILIAELNTKPIGFLLALPNLNDVLVRIKNGKLFPFGFMKLLLMKSDIKSLRVITVAVLQEFQHLGIGSLFYPEIARRAVQHGYQNTELSWVVEDNIQMNKICKLTGGVIDKRYRIYQGDI
jgi:GNAT superfamily N-acetyltransferase